MKMNLFANEVTYLKVVQINKFKGHCNEWVLQLSRAERTVQKHNYCKRKCKNVIANN